MSGSKKTSNSRYFLAPADAEPTRDPRSSLTGLGVLPTRAAGQPAGLRLFVLCLLPLVGPSVPRRGVQAAHQVQHALVVRGLFWLGREVM